ncbi:collagen alpha-5(VI) chain-like isoform X1 [Argopecten irradians]|uniref:collagen alpha-5(VI) chain-like isoform X1 n=1 Tax=Argopecten irradians TaxID=31199 RepID=UPI003715AF53
MTHGRWLVARYAFFCVWLWRFLYCSVPLGDFYDAGHSNCFNYSMYYSYQFINLTIDFDFFGDKYGRVLVTHNGVLVFGNLSWPSAISSIPGPVTHLAPFWLYNCWYSNTPIGHTCWREVTSGQELERVGEEMVSYFPELVSFNVTWMFIVSWINVPNCWSNNNPRNTFQAVLVTDGVLTFVIYNYNKIQYTSFDNGQFFGQVGFNKGDNLHYHAVEGSGTDDIGTIVSRSNVNRTGTFVFRLNGYMPRPVKVADIVFVIDSSYSETESFNNILQYIVNVTENFNIAPNETQVAVVSFSKTARVDFDFLSCENKDCVRESVLNVTHLNSTSYMETGLELASNLFLWTKGGRQSAIKYVVVVSDGLVNNRDKAINKATELSRRGIKVVSVGLGKSVHHTLLESVAFTSPYLLAPDPDKLVQLLQWELHDGNATGCTQDYNADILVVMETSASQNINIFKKGISFLQEFIDTFNPDHTNNSITISIADDTTNYIIQECQLSNLPYIMDSIRTIKQSQGKEHDWDNVLRFVDNHTSYSSVRARKYVMFLTSGLIPEESMAHVKAQLVHLRDNNDVRVLMVGDTVHTNWTVLENVYEYGFFKFSNDDANVVSRVLWNDISSIDCTKMEK